MSNKFEKISVRVGGTKNYGRSASDRKPGNGEIGSRLGYTDIGMETFPDINPNASLDYQPKADDRILFPCAEIKNEKPGGLRKKDARPYARDVNLEGVVLDVYANTCRAKVLLKVLPGVYEEITCEWAEITLIERAMDAG